jgi:hypothetical protein
MPWMQNPQKPYDPRKLPPVAQRLYRYRYRWALDLFEQFCLHAPHNDFLPNIAPSLYRTADGQPGGPAPVAVSNSGGVAGNSDDLDPANDYVEDFQSVEGLVNINTAPWKVLAALPMVLNDDGTVNAKLNAELAKAIVYYRDFDDSGPRGSDFTPHGPFKNVFELNEVTDTRPDALRKIKGAGLGFRNGYGTIDFAAGGKEPGLAAGDLSPGVAGKTDGVRGDFEENYLVLNRISNLITCRSDSFTCYVFVMGVQHDGAPDAAIKVQRRVAFIADRSAVRPLRPEVRTHFFNNE